MICCHNIPHYSTASFISYFFILTANRATISPTGVLHLVMVCWITCSMLNCFFSLSMYLIQNNGFLNLFCNHGNPGLMSLVNMATKVIRKISLRKTESHNTRLIEQTKHFPFRLHFQHVTLSSVVRQCTQQPSANPIDISSSWNAANQ